MPSSIGAPPVPDVTRIDRLDANVVTVDRRLANAIGRRCTMEVLQ
jgi:hypothetical protein